MAPVGLVSEPRYIKPKGGNHKERPQERVPIHSNILDHHSHTPQHTKHCLTQHTTITIATNHCPTTQQVLQPSPLPRVWILKPLILPPIANFNNLLEHRYSIVFVNAMYTKILCLWDPTSKYVYFSTQLQLQLLVLVRSQVVLASIKFSKIQSILNLDVN